MSDTTQVAILDFVRSVNSTGMDVQADTDLIETGVLDSLSVMELIAFLTDQFDVTIPAVDVTPVNLRNVGTLAALVQARSS